MNRKSRGFKWVSAILIAAVISMMFQAVSSADRSPEANGLPPVNPAVTTASGAAAPPALNTGAVSQAKKAGKAKTVYLTFDDGPSRLTPSVLSILKENGIKATFFVIGRQAAASPELIRQIVDGGHALGNHTYDHDYDKLYHNFSDFWAQIKQTEEVLRQITGYRTPLVRAPGGTYGHFDRSFFSLMDQAGYKVFDWDVDSGDSARPGVPVSEIVEQATDSGGKSSLVLLMHDGPGHDNTVKALPKIIQYYKGQGYRFAALTPDITPVQFHVGGKLPKGRKPPAQAWIDSHIKPNRALFEAGVPLNITAGGVQTRLDPGEYLLDNNVFYVPLRLTMERLGAAVTWNKTAGSAGTDWNHQSLTVSLEAKEGNNQAVNRSDDSLLLKNDAIWIPLRALFTGLNHPDISVQKSAEGWNVKVS